MLSRTLAIAAHAISRHTTDRRQPTNHAQANASDDYNSLRQFGQVLNANQNLTPANSVWR